MSHLGTWVAWKHARQQIDPASMIVDPHKTRGCVAMPAEAAKVSCSNQNFVSQRQAFYKSGGLSLVPVRPWSRRVGILLGILLGICLALRTDLRVGIFALSSLCEKFGEEAGIFGEDDGCGCVW